MAQPHSTGANPRRFDPDWDGDADRSVFQSKQYVFNAPQSAISAFGGAGVTRITEARQANNHGEDKQLSAERASRSLRPHR